MTSQNTTTKRTHIPQSAYAVIRAYQHLSIGEGKTVRCPYYRNPRSGRERWGLNAYSGKGSPKEIGEEIRIIEKLEGKQFSDLTEDHVRDLMRKRKLGIECSGFISHVLDGWLNAEKHTRIYSVLRFPARGLLGKIGSWLRPFTHIDIQTLTLPQNAKELASWKELQAGDIIRFHTTIDADTVLSEGEIDHAIFLTAVSYDQNDIPAEISYVHSVKEHNGEGVKEGRITIQNPEQSIEQQRWQETPDTGATVRERATTTPQYYHFSFLD